MAEFRRSERVSIREFLRSKKGYLFKAVPSDIGYRLSTIVRTAHTYVVTWDRVDDYDLAIELQRLKKIVKTINGRIEHLDKVLFDRIEAKHKEARQQPKLRPTLSLDLH